MSSNFSNKTCTSLFLVPLLGIDKEALDEFGFVMGYLDDVNHEIHYEESIYLLFKPKNLEEFNLFVRNETQNPARSLVDDYDYEGGYAVLVYRIPQRFLQDYQLFLEGKYSKFSESAKRMFPAEVIIVSQDGSRRRVSSFAYRIFDKEDSMKRWVEEIIGEELDKNAEYWTIPDLDREILDIDKIKK
jgi:hypothetical protein